jgi:hypothetical protein
MTSHNAAGLKRRMERKISATSNPELCHCPDDVTQHCRPEEKDGTEDLGNF